MTTRASVSVQSCSRLRHSSRKRPWIRAEREACRRQPGGSAGGRWQPLRKAVLPRAAGIDADGLDAVLRQPLLHDLGDELPALCGAALRAKGSGLLASRCARFAAVVAGQLLRRSMLLDGFPQPLQHVLRTQRPVRTQHVALPGVLIEDAQHSQCSSAHRRIRDEVPRPHVPTVRRLGRLPRGDSSAHDLPLARRHAQPGCPPKPLDVPLSNHPSFPPQQRRDPSVPVSRMLFGEFPQPPLHLLLAWRWHSPSIPMRPPGRPKEPARRTPRAHPCLHHLLCHCLAVLGWLACAPLVLRGGAIP